ncbi:similar to Saccharomyces cerevisiae YHR073W OSH3 Member of an oxysterol-binding protein family with seven members in S. cerevisiae [Maudiozyma saulgeensis]|uniref:Similar to Saccharomyces cerevisiae YHR073W OSH3 Member of an oxysterol-binding protein family with seven members in S. cerevisiae n=1 Tax=Maudiozyma saulgeensis TaxID=1789683 RepID=A0A1X7QYA0_9SACH|nr:similar to Saccharomyces cerevisiae YHR073W OSH3 Member of an oxysterol-binding protein family with seven members in S. cerevisiae [Kazachstania saulgeensis]
METIDIQNRSFVVRWVKCSHGDTINYQVKPLKKSIDLAIYKKLKTTIDDQTPAVHIAPDTKAALDFTNKAVLHRNNSISSNNDTHSKSSLSIANIQQQSQEKPLRDRLQASGFTLVKSVGHISGNKMYQGNVEVMDSDYYYAFILDNTASKNVKKKILFNASTIQTDTQSIHSTHSGSSPLLSSLNSSPNRRDSVFVVGQGRYIQGYLLKKRRKRLQGFKRRFFTLDFRYGTLSYYLNDHNQTRRGEIVIKLSTVSANKKDRLIIIDSGMEIWALKTKDVNCWQTWVQALQSCFEQDDNSDDLISDSLSNCLSENDGTIVTANDVISERLSRMSKGKKNDLIARPTSRLTDITSYIPLPNEAYEDFSANLLLIQQRLEQYKNDSLSYTPLDPEPTFADIRRSNSASSSLHGHSRIRGMSVASPMDSAESLLNPSDSAIPEITSGEHALYNNLAELEGLFNQFVKQSKVLYRDHNILTKQINDKRLSMGSSMSDDDMFYDAEDKSTLGVILLDDDDADDATQICTTRILGSSTVDSGEAILAERQINELQFNAEFKSTLSPIASGKILEQKEEHIISNDLYPLPHSLISRRNDVTICNSSPQSLLSFLRKNVGKDLTSITMPVTSNEPISILQTIAESFEYAHILHQLADPKSPFEPLAIVSAFAISSLSIYRDRTRSLRKPFNPLLGETYELVREDMGFRMLAEKVSHKPQIFAFHAEHENWECSYTVTPVQKFWGKSIELNNEGTFELKSKKSGEYFEWVQPTTMVKNLIAGERYVEPTNEIEVISSKSGKATISFEKTGMFSGRSENVIVDITSSNKSGKNQSVVGKWTDSLKDKKSGKTIWSVGETVKNPKQKYGFTKFTANLNEITSIEKDKLPPTDSRLRPDIRYYEEGKVDEAETCKLDLEQKQRERRQNGKDVTPSYFRKNTANKWTYIQGSDSYWEKRRRQDWNNAPILW